MTIFDAPSRESCIARRERTNTPLQALLLMNEEQYFQAAMHYANALVNESELEDAQRIKIAYESVTSQIPDERVLGQLENALGEFRQIYKSEPELAKQMLSESRNDELKAVDDVAKQTELASWTMIVHSLLNLDATKTLQ